MRHEYNPNCMCKRCCLMGQRLAIHWLQLLGLVALFVVVVLIGVRNPMPNYEESPNGKRLLSPNP